MRYDDKGIYTLRGISPIITTADDDLQGKYKTKKTPSTKKEH